MKAVVYENCESPDVLEYREMEKPAVMEDDVLVKTLCRIYESIYRS